MLPAFFGCMHPKKLALVLITLACGCGGSEATLTGTLAAEEGITHVWVLGEPERAEVVGDSFALAGLRAGNVELRFARDADEVGRMEIRELPASGRIRLREIGFEDGIAFPLAVEGDGAVRLEVNGVRLGSAAAYPADVDLRGTLLSRSRSGDALLVRPADAGLPDLRVVVTPGTEVRTEDGDPADLERTDFADTLRVVGVVEDGYVIAASVEVPRERARPVEEPRRGPRLLGVPIDEVRAEPAAAPAPAPEERVEREIRRAAERAKKELERAERRARDRGNRGRGNDG